MHHRSTPWKGSGIHRGFVLAVMLCAHAADAQITSLQWLNPYPQGNTLNHVAMADSSLAIAVGDNGTIVRTVNGGAHWRAQCNVAGVTTSLIGACLATEPGPDGSPIVKGLVVGENGVILRTSNAGERWVELPRPTSGTLRSVAHFKESSWIAAGDNGLMIKSTDDGATWSAVPISPWNPSLSGLAVIDEQTWIAVGQGAYRTTDAGAVWSRQLTQSASSVSFRGPDTGFIAAGIAILRSTDRGASWNVVNNNVLVAVDIAFFTPQVGVAAGYFPGTHAGIHGLTWSTTDGGLTWTGPYQAGTTTMLLGIATSGRRGIIVGEAGTILLRSYPDPAWDPQTTGPTYPLTSVSFADAYSAVLTGTDVGQPSIARALKTSDGGLTWKGVLNWTAGVFSKVFFSDANHCTVLDTGNHILIRSTQAGDSNTWSFQCSIPDSKKDIYFVDATRGWMAGSSITATTDGGSTWTTQLSGTDLAAIHFMNDQNGIAVGKAIYRTTNAGGAWTQVTSGVDLSGEDFTDIQNGMAVGVGGQILRTTDGGLTWGGRTSGTSRSLHSVVMSDANTAVAVGDSGTVLLTGDGGTSWARVAAPTRVNFHAVALVRNPILAALDLAAGSAGRLRGSDIFLLPSDPTLYILGEQGVILVAGLSPLHERTWTGSVDSNWFNAANWSPSGIPIPGDSVMIPATTTKPVMYQAKQQVTISTLTIESGGELVITDSLKRFTVMGDVTIHGTLNIRPPAFTTLIVGGNWVVRSIIQGLAKGPLAGGDLGFLPASSTVYFTGTGVCEKNFYNVVFDTASKVTSSGNIAVGNQCTLFNDLRLRPSDTLHVLSEMPSAIAGEGKILAGTVTRAISQDETASYRFESNDTYIRFDGTGLYPLRLSMTTISDTITASETLEWEVVGGVVDTQANTIVADSLQHLSKWRMGIPRVSASGATVGVHREYIIGPAGGSNYRTELKLRYDQAEVAPGVSEADLKLLRGPLIKGNVAAGWNMLSVPLIPEDPRVGALFPGAISPAFAFIGLYIPCTTMVFGTGYWLKFPSLQERAVMGNDLAADTIPLGEGWNLVGSISYPVNVRTSVIPTPPDVIASAFYGWQKSYQAADTLFPMHAYWVKARSPGIMVLTRGAGLRGAFRRPAEGTTEETEKFTVLTLRDGTGAEQRLLFGESASPIDCSHYEMPPLPPEGAFDARFETGRMLEISTGKESRQIAIAITGARYPLTIQWRSESTQRDHSKLKVGTHELDLGGTGQVSVSDPSRPICLVLSPSEENLPRAYALEQNYPNPFNPATVIRYALPRPGHVTLRVYDLLGREVARLVESTEEAGFKSVAWDAKGVSSGVYVYRLTAGQFTATKKLVVVR